MQQHGNLDFDWLWRCWDKKNKNLTYPAIFVLKFEVCLLLLQLLCFPVDGTLKTEWSGGKRRAGCFFSKWSRVSLIWASTQWWVTLTFKMVYFSCAWVDKPALPCSQLAFWSSQTLQVRSSWDSRSAAFLRGPLISLPPPAPEGRKRF